MKNKIQNSSTHSHWAEKTNHTRLKHVILENYLKEWAAILAGATHFNKLEDIYYIDGFAGRGIFLNGDIGSPLIAAEKMLRVQKEHNEKYPNKPLRFHVINIENEQTNYEMLEEIRMQSSRIVDVQNILGNFKEQSNFLLENKRVQSSACFWFVDPFYGARDFTFSDVLDLMFNNGKPRYRKEVLINFMTYNIVRFLDHELERPYILDFLGASSVSEVLKEATLEENTREQAIINFYKKKLRENGLYVLTQRIQCKDPKVKDADKVYFHMVHCSHNERALIEMRNAFVKVREQKRTFEKQLEGDIIDFFDLGLLDYSEFEVSHQQLIRFIEGQFGFNNPMKLKILMTMLLQEIDVSYDELKSKLHDLFEQDILMVRNLDNVNRRKPFNTLHTSWSDIEVSLTTRIFRQAQNVGDQLTLFDY